MRHRPDRRAPGAIVVSPGEWAAVVGWGREGRSDLTREIVAELQTRGQRLGGCLQQAIVENDEIVGYDLVTLDDGHRYALARPSDDPEVCNWGFDAQVFAAIRTRLLSHDDYDLVVLELGPIEARGRGHWELVSALLARGNVPLLLCIRPRVLARIALELPDPAHALELPAAGDDVERFVEALARRPEQIDFADRRG